MVNLYKLLNVLEQGMSLFQLNKWKTEGIWYPITQYKKESDEIQVVTNLFIPEQKEYHIQLSGNYPEESESWRYIRDNMVRIRNIISQLLDIYRDSDVKKTKTNINSRCFFIYFRAKNR